MTPTWQPIAARIIQLIAAATVGAVAVVVSTRGQVRAVTPLTATDIGFAQDMSAHHQQAVAMPDTVATDAARRFAYWPSRSDSPSYARSDK